MPYRRSISGGKRRKRRSKTRKGRLDYVTHRGDKDYHEGKHYVRKSRRPYSRRRKSRSKRRSLRCA